MPGWLYQNEFRREIIEYLAYHGRASVFTISRNLGKSTKRVKYALNRLRDDGLVSFTEAGRQRYWELNSNGVKWKVK